MGGGPPPRHLGASQIDDCMGARAELGCGNRHPRSKTACDDRISTPAEVIREMTAEKAGASKKSDLHGRSLSP